MLEYALDKIQTLLDEGKITEEAANSMAESFVNQYMTEGNAYNKAIDRSVKNHDRNLDRYDQLDEKNEKLLSIYKKTNDPKTRAFLDKQMSKIEKEQKTIRDQHRDYRNKHGLSPRDLDNWRFSTKHKDVRRLDPSIYKGADDQQTYTNSKKEWMKNHGNTGERPEDKYKAGRYLDIQKAMKESFDEMQLGLYEAADAGLIDPDFIPVMIEAVEFYLES